MVPCSVATSKKTWLDTNRGWRIIPGPKLNGWGLAFVPDGPFWVADTATGVSTLYDHQGKPQPL